MSQHQPSAKMYFPPPPTSATPSRIFKKNGKSNFSAPRSSSGASSSSSIRPKSILKNRMLSTKVTRQWILLSLLILSFTILVLSVIFAYCAALPHSDNLAATAQSASGLDTSTPAGSTPTATYTLLDASATATASNRGEVSSPADAVSKSVEEALSKDASNQARFNSPSAMASLTFYTALLPLLTMVHTSTELLVSLIRPATSQGTKLGDLLRLRGPAPLQAQDALARRRTAAMLSFCAAASLAAGWFTMQFFWINCEISLLSPHSEAVCPVQIRGHSMGGVSDLSIGKVVLAFAVLIGYLAYAGYLVVVVGVFRAKQTVVLSTGVSGFRRQARFARRANSDDVESVVIGIEDKEMR